MQINKRPMDGSKYVVLDRNELLTTDWATVCAAVDCETTPARLATMAKTAKSYVAMPRCHAAAYERNPDGTIQMRPIMLATPEEQRRNMDRAARGGDR